MLCFACLPKTGSFESTARKIAEKGFTELSIWLPAADQASDEQGSLTAVRKFLGSIDLRVSILEMMVGWTNGDAGPDLFDKHR